MSHSPSSIDKFHHGRCNMRSKTMKDTGDTLPALLCFLLSLLQCHHSWFDMWSSTMKDTADIPLEDLRSLRGDAPDDPLSDTGGMAHRVSTYRYVTHNTQPNQDVIDNKQPNQDVIDNKQPNQDVIYNKQPNQDVIDNKQPNQDVIYNKQPNQDVIDNKQPNQDVIDRNQTVTRNHTDLYKQRDGSKFNWRWLRNKIKYRPILRRMSRFPLSIHELHHGRWGTTMKETVTRKRTDIWSTTMKDTRDTLRKLLRSLGGDAPDHPLNDTEMSRLHTPGGDLQIRPHPSGGDGELWSRYLLTNVLLLFLVLPSTVVGSTDTNHQSSRPLQSSCDLQGRRICWLTNDTTVKEVCKKDVKLVWKYNSREPVDEILITRSDDADQQIDNVGSWTLNGGSKTNRVLSTDVNLQHRTEGDVGIIILTLIKAYPVDFDKQYLCQVSIKKRTYSNRKLLKAIKIEYRPVTEVVEGRPGEDVKFVWRYKYPLPVKVLIFHKDTHPVEDMMTWTNQFEDVEDEYKNRLRLNMTSNHDQVEITLTLLDTTADDYDHTYFSLVVGEEGNNVLAHMFLSDKGNQVEQKLVVDRKEKSPSSTASGVFTSNLWICFILILFLFY